MKILYLKREDVEEWLLKKHYAHRIPCITDAFGLYLDGCLVGVCTYGVPASPNLCIGVCGEKWKSRVRELSRLCIDDDISINNKNIGSRFVSATLRRMRMPEGVIIVSYADTGMNHVGYIYQACNFLYTGATKERTDISTEDGKHSRHYSKDQDYTLNRKKRTSKHRYVYFQGTKKQKKEMLADLKYPILPYPKGESKRYDAGYKPVTQQILFDMIGEQ